MKHLRTIMAVTAILFLAASQSSSTDNYHFGSASFKTEMWINNKAVFTKPADVNVEFVTSGAFDWVISDAQGKEVRTVRHKNEHGGWTGIDFSSLGLFGDYSIGFRNASSGEQEIKQGDVRLK